MKFFAVFVLALCAGATLRAADGAPVVAVLESNLLWVSASRISNDFATQLHAAEPTNRINGTILDLRVADGDNAAAALDYFSTKKTPLIILVNGQTEGAAVELAKTLRAAGTAVVIGTTNGKVQPDIAVTVRATDEKIFLQNPYAKMATNSSLSLSATNSMLPYVDHTSEADLVRKRIKDGEDESDATNSPRVEPAQPVIRDPLLARAVDLLKALAILHPSRG